MDLLNGSVSIPTSVLKHASEQSKAETTGTCPPLTVYNILSTIINGIHNIRFPKQEVKMPRFSMIAGFIIAAISALITTRSEVVERREAAKLQAELDELMKSILEICTRLELEQSNHITRNPCFVAASIPQLWEVPQYLETARACGSDEPILDLEAALSVLFDLRDADSTREAVKCFSIFDNRICVGRNVHRRRFLQRRDLHNRD
jgi:hypothetical protein